ncbi:MAG TPA: hypothetical protein DD434_05025 [Bacteroidales bacterium]|nr:hypothetical protein [Bacteroidales bacterium]
MKKLLSLSLIMFSCLSLSAQDLIVRKNPKAEINCKIVEIGEDLVYYSAQLGGEERRFSIDKNNIVYIKFANGEVLKMEDSMFGQNHYQDNTNNAIKFNFLAPFMGFSEFDYERSIKPGQSWTAGLGIIGLGFKTISVDAIGLSISGGYRFYRSPDYYLRNMKYAHLLKGSYVMPKIKFSLINAELEYYQYDYYNNYYGNNVREDKNIATLNLMITGGKQWVFANRFLIDLNVGIGYSFSNIDEDSYDYYELGLIYGAGTHFTYSSSLKIGYLFHDKKQPKTVIPQ